MMLIVTLLTVVGSHKEVNIWFIKRLGLNGNIIELPCMREEGGKEN